MTTKELKQVNGRDFLTSEEAAERLGIKPNVIRNYLSQEKLTTYKFKTLTLLDVKEVEQWKGRKKDE